MSQTRHRFLHVAIVGMVLSCIWFEYLSIRAILEGKLAPGLLGLPLWACIAIGLWRLRDWGRVLALVMLWWLLLITVGPAGEISVLSAMNGAEPPLPLWPQWWSHVLPYAVPAAFFIEVLNAYRREFPINRFRDPSADGSTDRPPLPRSWIAWGAAIVLAPSVVALMLSHGADLQQGCMPRPGLDPAGRWTSGAVANLLIGWAAFAWATPIGAPRRTLIIRAAIYGIGAILLVWQMHTYLDYINGCVSNG